jgi:CRISPR-associated endonuclease Csn1
MYLGLNLAPSFIAYSVVDQSNSTDPIKISGIHYFTPAENPKTGESLNMPRAQARRKRLLLKRTKRRLLRLKQYMYKAFQFKESPLFAGLMRDAWNVRVKALDEKLTISEFASVVCHISNTRGYSSNRLNNEDDDKKGLFLDLMNKTKEQLSQSSARTYAEYLKNNPIKRNRNGNFISFPTREMLINEYDQIVSSQLNLKSDFLTPESAEKIKSILFWQRPLKAVEQMIGNCSIYPEEKRAPKHSFTTNIFNLLQKINSLRIVRYKPSYEEFQITLEHVRTIIFDVFQVKKVSWNRLRKILKITEEYKINLEENGTSSAFFEFSSFHALQPIVNSIPDFKFPLDKKHPDQILDNAVAIQFYDKLIFLLSFIFDYDDLREKIISLFEEFGCIHGQREDLFDIVEKLSALTQFSGTSSLSIKAMNFFIQHLQEGYTYRDIYEEYFKNELTSAHVKKLPPFESTKNPVVDRVNAEARKLLNSIMNEYPIDDVFITSSKELGKSMSDRRKMVSRNKVNQQINDEVREIFLQLGIENVSDHFITKGKLWLLQNKKCLFTNKPIPENLLISNKVAVTHIIPYSRSFDDSFDNKALVYAEVLAKKKNKTLYEISKDNDDYWKGFVSELNKMYEDKQIRKRKIEKLLCEEINEEELKSRHINDSRYINKRFKEHLTQYLFDKNRVHAIPKQLLSSLKSFWNLHDIQAVDGDGEKIDSTEKILEAILLTYASRNIVENISNALKADEQLESVPMPFLSFADKIKEALSKAKLNRMICAKVKGELHGETLYRLPPIMKEIYEEHENFVLDPELCENKENKVRQFVRLENLRLLHIDKIVAADHPKMVPIVAEIKARLEAHNDKGEKAFIDPIFVPGKFNMPVRIYGVEIFIDMRSGIFKSNGVAANGDLVRVDVFSKDFKLYICPIYAMDAIKNRLPNIIIDGRHVAPLDSSFEFKGSLFKNCKIILKKMDEKGNFKTVVEGFFNTINRSNSAIMMKNITKKVYEDGVEESFYYEDKTFSMPSFSHIQIENYSIFGQKTFVTAPKRVPFTLNQKRVKVRS